MASTRSGTSGTKEAEQAIEAFTLNRWQRFHFKLNSRPLPRESADAARGILGQLHVASVCSELPDEWSCKLKLKYNRLYSGIVDCSNPDMGLNNFAEGSLALSANHPNESSKWVSTLSKESVMKLPWIKEVVADAKRASQCRADEIQKAADNLQAARKPASAPPGTRDSPQLSTRPAAQQPPSGRGVVPPAGSRLQSSVQKPPCPALMPKQTPLTPGPDQPHRDQPGFSHSLSRETAPRPSDRLPAQMQETRCGQTPAMNRAPVSAYAGPPRPSEHFPARGPTHPVRHQRPCNPLGVGRSAPGVGSMGYDPASQMCSLGVLGVGNGDAGSTGQPSLKRKFEATDNGGHANFQPGPQNQPYRGGAAGPGQSWFNRGPNPRPRLEEEEGGMDGGGGEPAAQTGGPFRSAREQLSINNQKKFGNRGGGASSGPPSSGYGSGRKVLGVTRRGPNSKFVPPVMNKDDGDSHMGGYKPPTRGGSGSSMGHTGGDGQQETSDERLKNIDPKMVELVMSEIMDHGPPIHWDDIAGLEFAKNTIREIVVWPMLRPDIFTGLRGPPKGLLLFGPPGTGKTLIGKCIACQSGATFFSISASSLTSKWVGEGEKMVRALFAVARCYQPAVIFIDEIDSLLSQRSNDEHESSRRIKTEFLVQLDGATTSSDERLLIVGATNRPQEIDEAARRRLVKRLYIPLPDEGARRQIVCSLLSQQGHSLNDQELMDICSKTDGYSGADMANLCREAALGPIRSIQGMDIQHISAEQVRPIVHGDFVDALQNVRPSVAQSDLDIYLDWNSKFGCGSAK